MTIIYPMFVINETDVRFYISYLSKNVEKQICGCYLAKRIGFRKEADTII
jgi:hypothetical protein